MCIRDRDLIVTLIPAKDQEELDRLGLEREGLDVLGENGYLRV